MSKSKKTESKEQPKKKFEAPTVITGKAKVVSNLKYNGKLYKAGESVEVKGKKAEELKHQGIIK